MKRTIRYAAVAVLALGLAYAFGLGQAQAADYEGTAKCKICHNKKDTGSQYDKWKAMDHAKAFETLKSPESVKIGQDKGLEKPPSESPECLKCHVTAYDVAAKAVPAKIKLEEGVSCEQCHGPSSEHTALAMKQMKDKSIDLSGSQPEVKAEVCTKCHNDESPTWNPERYTLDDGKKVGFDFEQAQKKIDHSNPKKVEGG